LFTRSFLGVTTTPNDGLSPLQPERSFSHAGSITGLQREQENSSQFYLNHRPQQTSIDVTPDIMALLGGVQTDLKPLGEARNLLEARDLGWDVATRVHFP
jgi:hypothetical protein